MAHKPVIRLLVGVFIFKLALVLWGSLAGSGSIWDMWDHWDSNVYKTIATQWYAPVNVPPDYVGFLSHFPPLYPIAIFLVAAFFPITPQVAGILISWAAILAASYVLYRLVLEETGDRSLALHSVLFLTIWPVSYFTIALYSESLSLLFILCSFYALRTRRFGWAGVAGAAAILTRLPSIAIVPTYAVVLWRLYRQRDKQFWHAAISLFLGSVIAVLAYLSINAIHYGDPFFFRDEYRTNPFSSKHLIVPFKETAEHLAVLVKDAGNYPREDFMMVHGWNALFTLAALIITVTGMRMKLPWEYSVFALASILLFASFSWGISNARYTLPIFPLFMVLARLKPGIRLPVIAVCLYLLFAFTSVFVAGGWAF